MLSSGQASASKGPADDTYRRDECLESGLCPENRIIHARNSVFIRFFCSVGAKMIFPY